MPKIPELTSAKGLYAYLENGYYLDRFGHDLCLSSKNRNAATEVIPVHPCAVYALIDQKRLEYKNYRWVTTAPHNGVSTSVKAAKSIQPKLQYLEMLVMIYFHTVEGATCDECEVKLNLPHQTVSARINGLVKKGMLFDSGKKRLTRNGRKAIVWER